MKKLLMLLIAISCYGCKGKTLQEVSEATVKQYLGKTLDDPGKYKPGSFTPLKWEAIGDNKDYLLPTYETTDSVNSIMHMYTRATEGGGIKKTSQIFLLSKDGKKIVGELGEL